MFWTVENTLPSYYINAHSRKRKFKIKFLLKHFSLRSPKWATWFWLGQRKKINFFSFLAFKQIKEHILLQVQPYCKWQLLAHFRVKVNIFQNFGIRVLQFINLKQHEMCPIFFPKINCTLLYTHYTIVYKYCMYCSTVHWMDVLTCRTNCTGGLKKLNPLVPNHKVRFFEKKFPVLF